MKKLFFVLLFITFLIIFNTALAQSPEIIDGLNYLTTTQNPDGSWGDETSNTEPFPATTSIIETLQTLNETSSQNYTDAVSWLQSQSIDTTDYFSERIHALSVEGTDKDLLLSYLDDLTGAWGGYLDFEVNILDTALTILALNEINYSDLDTINYALFYLTSNQNSDGGWGFYPSTHSTGSGQAGSAQSSNVYMTALVLMTLQQFYLTPEIATAINKATDYLIAHQNPDGGFGTSTSLPTGQAGSGSSVYETALAYIALVSITTDAALLGNAVNTGIMGVELP